MDGAGHVHNVTPRKEPFSDLDLRAMHPYKRYLIEEEPRISLQELFEALTTIGGLETRVEQLEEELEGERSARQAEYHSESHGLVRDTSFCTDYHACRCSLRGPQVLPQDQDLSGRRRRHRQALDPDCLRYDGGR